MPGTHFRLRRVLPKLILRIRIRDLILLMVEKEEYAMIHGDLTYGESLFEQNSMMSSC